MYSYVCQFSSQSAEVQSALPCSTTLHCVATEQNLSMNKIHIEIIRSVKNTTKFVTMLSHVSKLVRIFVLNCACFSIFTENMNSPIQNAGVKKKRKKTINASAVRSTTIFMIASNYYIDAIRRFGIHCLLRSIRLAISFFRSFYSEWTANRVCEFINQNDANQFKLTPHTICAACIAANKHHMCDRYGKTCWNRFN